MDLENSKSDTIIIRVGINDLLNGSNEIQIDSLIQNIGAVIEKCRFSGKKFNFISGLVYTTTGKLSIKKKLTEVFCCNNGVINKYYGSQFCTGTVYMSENLEDESWQKLFSLFK